ncbi:hypothetical protein HXX76_015139 [Chlamydomonas incerta]|uniref:Uncharacterized protein n=1 Tax=Chlamydomonas incerta TaxID=51695 RepID=A0A835SPG5_CHLIN|nr:hypothetical protein HXX76_015139 [Chlamydomonas incerta]|eukprot:KAG2423621.1 hypothetical protein HXX76_015139 [Chlamydomonas incerta]
MGSFTSPLAQFRRCKSLRIRFVKAKDDDEIPHPSLLAGWLVAGMGADVARNITTLSLEGALDLPTLTTVSLVLAGTLRHVHTLKLNTFCCGSGGFGNFYALHSALRGAFPALGELCLPGKACLRGLEAFAGSALHTVRVLRGSPGRLRLSHVRSLLQLSQLRHLDLAGAGWEAKWDKGVHGHKIWGDEADVDADEDTGVDAAQGGRALLRSWRRDLAQGHAQIAEAFRHLCSWGEEWVQEMWALRRLLASAPPALESLWLPGYLGELNFEGGRITRAAVVKVGIREHDAFIFAAAVLLPRLEATGQRLPLFRVEALMDDPAGVISLLQPHSAFARLLAKCDRVELGLLMLRVDSVQLGTEAAAAAAAAAALQALARAMGGGLPNQLGVSGPSWDCRLRLRPRCERGSGDRVAAADGRGGSGGRGTGGAAMAAPAAVMELTAEQVLERAADKMWAAASAQGAASMAEAAMDAYLAAGATGSQERRSVYFKLQRMNVLLRGPLVWQLTCAPGAGGGARLLTDWLGNLVAAGPPPPSPPFSMGVNAAVGAAGLKMRGCSFAPCGPGSAVAVVKCDCPIAALQLHRAVAAAAAREAPSYLQVSAARVNQFTDCLRHAIAEVVRELWDDHLSSAPQPAAAAGAAVGAGGPADGGGGGGGGGGGPAKTTAASAGGEPARAPSGEPARAPVGGQPARDAAAGGGGGGDDDLQVLMRLLQLAEQAHAAVVRVDLDNA